MYRSDVINRTTERIGIVGLIYLSYYVYASSDVDCENNILGENGTCKNNNWLHPTSSWYWTFSPHSSTSLMTSVWRIDVTRNVYTTSAYVAGRIHPYLYRSSNIKNNRWKW